MVKSSKILNSGIARFRPRARLLYLLGHELISDEIIAVIELVKNSYDADAREVHVTLTDVTNKNDGRISIRDDGHGMTLDIVKEAWMEPARDIKRGKDGQRQRTKRFSRLPLGEKGVGRFSVDKLGLRLELVTRFCKFNPKTKEVSYLSPEEVVLVVEGKKFVEDSYLDEVECQWFTREPEEFREEDHGTMLSISELRADWSRELVERVRLGLARLSSPLSQAKDFEIFFISNEFPELSAKIENPLFDVASYQLDAKIDENGVMHYVVKGFGKEDKGKKDLRVGSERFFESSGKEKNYRKPTCGPFRFRLYAFERDRSAWKKYGMDKPKLDLLNALCGVSIYRDNFRVLPYGERGNDWLIFDRRRVQAPGRVLGNDRVIGYVEISQGLNPQLRDKTNREGLIEEGSAFADLRELSINASDFLSLYRYLSFPHEKRSKVKIEEAKEDIEKGSQTIKQTSSKAMATLESAKKKIEEGKVEDAEGAIGEATHDVGKAKEASKQIDEGANKLLEELNLSEEQIKNLISLSGIGMTAERMTHELSKAVRNAQEALTRSFGILANPKVDIPEVKKNLSLARGQLDIVSDALKQMEPLYYSKRRYTEELDVGKIAKDMESFFSNTIKELDIDLKIVEDPKLYVNMGKGHLMQIFNNLFDNSFYWLKYAPPEDRPKITIRISGKEKSLVFADNGPGIDEQVRYHLFEPFVSTKPEGRGLGLYIVQDILQNYKAEIEPLFEKKILEGANFKITFSEVGQ